MKNFTIFSLSGLIALTSAGMPLAGMETVFIPNAGQYRSNVQFVSFPEGVSFRTNGMDIRGIRVSLIGNRDVSPKPLHRREARFNYYRGKDPSLWRTGLPSFASLKYEEIYEGVDLTFVGTEGRMEFHWTVKPGADPGDIRIHLSGGKASLEDGKVVVRRSGKVVMVISEPEAYQGADEVQVSYALSGDTLSFVVGEYDPSRPLVIDPMINNLAASTFLGGSSSERGMDVVSTSDAVYVVGTTYSTDFPGNGSLSGGSDVFVAKFSRDLNTLLSATYYGGSDYDDGFGIAVLGSDVFICGSSQSSNLPTPGGAFTTYSGNVDGFVAQFDTSLALVSATYLGGSQYDVARSLAFNGAYVYVVGRTASPNFPVQNGYDLTHNGSEDIFVARLLTPSSLLSATFIGGSDSDWGIDLALNPVSMDVVVVGWTASANYPTVNAYSTTLSGTRDAVVSVLTGDLLTLNSSTYVGGTRDDRAYGVDFVSGSEVMVVGWTSSPDFPVVGSSTAHSGVGDAFVFRLNGSNLAFSRYLGGADNDVAGDVLVRNPVALVVGHTSSSNFPTRPGAYDNTFGGMVDAFVTRFNLTTDSLEESTYLGGANDDEAFAVGLYGDSTYVVGVTGSPSFPANAYDTTLGGVSDAFVSLFDQAVATAVEERENVRSSFEAYRDRLVVSLREASYVGVDVYTYNGRRVGSVSAGFLPKGQHTVALPDLPKGRYVLKVRMGREVRTLKVVR